jgi:O-antigen/teichoic acid export membrane protein
MASKIVVIVNGVFYWGLVSDERYDKYASLAMIGTAVFSLLFNLILIPKWGMYAASSINLTSEVVILVACVWISVKKQKSLKNKVGNQILSFEDEIKP